MAIREVNKIPKSTRVQIAQPFDYTNRIMEDLTEAYGRHLSTFELIDYDSPTYVASYSREIATRFMKKVLYTPTAINIKNRVMAALKPELGELVKYIRTPIPATAEPAIKIYGVTVNGEKRVFVKIDYDYIEQYEDQTVNKYVKYYGRPEAQEKLQREYNREVIRTAR